MAVRRVAVLVSYYTLLSWRCCCSWRCGALVGLLAGLHYTALSWWCCGERKLLVASLRAARGGAGGGDARNRVNGGRLPRVVMWRAGTSVLAEWLAQQ